MVVQLKNAKHVALNRDIPADDSYTPQVKKDQPVGGALRQDDVQKSHGSQ